MIVLRLPHERNQEQVMAYKEAFLRVGDDLAGTAGLRNNANYHDWLLATRLNQHETTVKEGLVLATTFLAFNEENLLVGMIDIRHTLNDFLTQFGGHIGYSVHPLYRRKGYAKAMLKEALIFCETRNIDPVLITCDATNTASKKTILALGGVYQNTVIDADKQSVERYLIHLKTPPIQR